MIMFNDVRLVLGSTQKRRNEILAILIRTVRLLKYSAGILDRPPRATQGRRLLMVITVALLRYYAGTLDSLIDEI